MGPGRRRIPAGDHDNRHDLRRIVRHWWPLGPAFLSGLLIALAFWLDTGGPGERDAALLIGSLALYVLLPLSLLTIVVVLGMRRRTRQPTAQKRPRPTGAVPKPASDRSNDPTAA